MLNSNALRICEFLALAADCCGCRTAGDAAGMDVRSQSPVTTATPPPAPPPVPPPLIAPLTTQGLLENESNTISIFQSAAASTAFVTQKRVVVDYLRGRVLEVPAGSGSGFVWDQQGHIVTNYHVIQGAQSLTVTLLGQESFDAAIVGVDPRKDIAVLKIQPKGNALVPIRVRQPSARLEVGRKTVAIGNPFGLDHTLTTGVVSALGRQVKGIGGVTIRDMVQTDAAINPGNSGGPLLDSEGFLIGMNTMIFSRSGASAGIGFAVPVKTISRIVPQIIRNGHAEQVGLGIQIDPEQRLERQARILGVAVLEVVPGSPAATAGLRGIRQTRRSITLGDIIVKLDNASVENYDDLYNALDGKRPGHNAQVTVLRGDKRLQLTIPLVVVH